VFFSAPRGQNEIAQGATLGDNRKNRCALKGRDEAWSFPEKTFFKKMRKNSYYES
jgi:hypothetical protein